jgi:glycosyltransferase involved in cell wall biosynthesis
MKVLHAITGLNGGGAEYLLLDVVQEMVSRGISQQVVYYTPVSLIVHEFWALGIKPIFIDEPNFGLMNAIHETKRVIDDMNPTILHTHLPRADIIGRTAGLSTLGLPCFTTVHRPDEWRTEKTPTSLFLSAFDRATINYSRRVRLIAVSEICRTWCIEKTHIRPDRITTLSNFTGLRDNKQGNGVSRASLGIAPEDLVLVNAARIQPEKCQIDIIRSAAVLKAQGVSDIKFLILGDGQERETLERAVREQGLESTVSLLGFQQNVYDYYAISDAFLLSSKLEGAPVSLMEAFDRGLPAITSAIPATLEMMNDGAGIQTYPLNDIQARADLLLDIRKDRDVLRSLARKSTEYIKERTVKKYVDQLLSMYDERARSVAYRKGR